MVQSRLFIPNSALLRFSNLHGQAHGHALGRAHTMGGDTAVRYCRVKTGYTISTLRGKETAIPSSKKRKGATSSSGPTAEIRYPFLQFPFGPQEELFQILRVRPLGVGHCIDWAALKKIQMADVIIEPMYHELTMELYSTFHLQVAMINCDDPRTVQFHLSGLVRQLSVPKFRIALGLYMEEFMDDNELDTLYCHIHYSLSKCWKDFVPASATYDPNYSKASALTPSL
ncbi:hypothetical protein GOBAR_AA37014 [Gossypium barbadense]|uniref:Uncharacterized protein n=1 Tax=Gossypium barbadense TaxID=3634 RepID=A0A2P5VY12_GOSBA|nr:hypothetical protein GOBAR_AA37014 [Gossypium barbadense]